MLEPYQIKVEAQRKYFWCACGRTTSPPFCDGSHTGTGITPFLWTAQHNTTVYLCGCYKSNTPPFCDGTHKKL